MVDYKRVHEEAIVFDGTCPLLTHSPEHTSFYVEGGVTVVAPSLAANHNCGEAIMRIADWMNIIRERSRRAHARHRCRRLLPGKGRRQDWASSSTFRIRCRSSRVSSWWTSITRWAYASYN